MLKNAFEHKKKQETGGEKWTSGGDDDDAVDSEHVNELSDLFSTIENEFADGSAIDFSVLLEGEHAFNVEEVSEIFTDLEGSAATPAVTTQDVDDAAVVDEVAALFASLEELRHEEEGATEAEVDTDSDNESTEGAAVGAADVKDAENVDELSDLFSALEEKESESAVGTANQADWIASLDVDDVSALYSELETLQQQPPQPTVVKEERVVDPRIFVPRFAVRMDGAAAAPAVPLHRVGSATGAFLAGPPGLLLAGPPVRHANRGVGLAPPPPQQEKRKAAACPIISATRRICAAKRRRVNGRFVREQNSFVSITSLQPTP